MPWNETCAMSERKSLIDAWMTGQYNHTELCRRFGISRRIGYKWLARYAEEGKAGLADRSRAPHSHPNQTPASVVAALLEFKHQHPKWGAYAIIHYLRRHQPDQRWPSVSTAGVIFDRHGLVKHRQPRKHVPPHTEPLRHATTPYSVWSSDYKGDFAMGNGRRCYPLTISDNHSRFLIVCQGMYSIGLDAAKHRYKQAFSRYGLPQAMRTDNGYPFASCGAGGLNALSIWLLKLDIMPERIAPGCPEQNPRHERMHRTLKHFAIDPAKGNLSAQQRAFNRFRQEYNFDRPHQALDGETPSDRFTASPRPYPQQLTPIEYDEVFEVRSVRHDGSIKWRGRQHYLSQALAKESVGLKPIDNDCWQIYFARLSLGLLDERLGRIVRPR